MSQKSTIYSEYIDSQQDQVEKHKQDLLNKNKEEAQLQENDFINQWKIWKIYLLEIKING